MTSEEPPTLPIPDGVVACAACDTVFRVHPAGEGFAMRDACPACGGPPGVYIMDIVLPLAAEAPAASADASEEPAPADLFDRVPEAPKEPGGAPSAEPPPEQAAADPSADAQPNARPGEADGSAAAGSVEGGGEEEMASPPPSLDKPVSA